MNKRTRTRVIKGWQKRLNLDHWRVVVDDDDTPPENAEAAISCSIYYDQAIMVFREDWPSWDIAKLNLIVVHELLHIVYDRLRQAALTTGNVHHSDTRMLYEDRLNFELESSVERVAHVMVQLGGLVQ